MGLTNLEYDENKIREALDKAHKKVFDMIAKLEDNFEKYSGRRWEKVIDYSNHNYDKEIQQMLQVSIEYVDIEKDFGGRIFMSDETYYIKVFF